MPAKLPVITTAISKLAIELGQKVRARRKALGVNATSAAEAAGMSRVTWYRLEKGETSITLGAYLSALAVLDLGIVINADDAGATDQNQAAGPTGWLPSRIPLTRYPQLKQLAWQVRGTEELSPLEAHGIYERNTRHLDLETLEPHERKLIEALRMAFESEKRDV